MTPLQTSGDMERRHGAATFLSPTGIGVFQAPTSGETTDYESNGRPDCRPQSFHSSICKLKLRIQISVYPRSEP